ncbi:MULTISPECIES: polysaccharide biosynthesis C-terminal domain-containing protein [Sphingobacterium]|uniref:MATE family efflux transporter n=1 Tax=Sphingobacterium TaxID=28453 RepID=UPI00293BCACE|nr:MULTISPECIES: polysaccharide biosynthesis C-terminal domain-containing protein [unclassified Sphingobacterium]
MSSIKKFLSDTVIYGMTTIVSRMISFLMTPIYLRKFQNAGTYGIYTSFYAWVSMLNAILAFGMETTFFRYLQKQEIADKDKVYNNSFFVTLFMSVLLLGSVFIFTRPIASFFSEGGDIDLYVQYVKFFAFILVADALAVVPFAKIRAQGRPVRYSYLKFINIFVTVGLNLFFIVFLPRWRVESSFWASFSLGWFQEGWLGYVFISNLVASVLTLVLLAPELLKVRLKVDKVLLKNMLRYSFPILIANISFIINENLDKMFFRKLLPGELGVTELGVYGAVAKIAIFLNLFVTAFRLGAEPFFFSHANNANAPRTYAAVMKYFVILMVLVMIGLNANISWIKEFIEGNAKNPEEYWSGLKILPVLLFNYVLLGVYMNLSVWYKLTDQTKYAIYISGVGALVTIALNVLLIPLYSYVGAVLSTSLVYLVMIGLSLFWGQKYYSIPYAFGSISLYLLIGLVISLASCFVFDSNVWVGNLLLIVFSVCTFFLEKNAVLKLLGRR